jgi:hypothetical protein
MYTNSGLLQAVISCRGNGKFYRLPPDKENPESAGKTLGRRLITVLNIILV